MDTRLSGLCWFLKWNIFIWQTSLTTSRPIKHLPMWWPTPSQWTSWKWTLGYVVITVFILCICMLYVVLNGFPAPHCNFILWSHIPESHGHPLSLHCICHGKIGQICHKITCLWLTLGFRLSHPTYAECCRYSLVVLQEYSVSVFIFLFHLQSQTEIPSLSWHKFLNLYKAMKDIHYSQFVSLLECCAI